MDIAVIISPPNISDDQLLNTDPSHDNNMKMVDYYTDLILDWLDTDPFIKETDEMVDDYATLSHVREFLSTKMETDADNHIKVFFNNHTKTLMITCNHQVACHLHIIGYDLLEESLVDG